MAAYSQASPGDETEQPPESTSLIAAAEATTPAMQERLQQLQEMLRRGALVENGIWSFKMTDWVVGLHATDIDGDGDREILIASRDGQIKAFTRYGSQKWGHTLTDQQQLNALAVRAPEGKTPGEGPCVILGLRSGRIMALNKDGDETFPEWSYDTGRLIRQIAVSKSESDLVVIGSDDRAVHGLEGATGRLRWKYVTGG